ncbi:flagellar hook assembly protein FlgD [Sphingorhabdus sp. M41]|uniref:flagellar hook assembly protein FlgD n=1 Tax=Sphingorhabdus sp. M41 TaxID=1806885 RepID=UPI0009EE6DA9|nr:flagellar hook capping FlgD N-terminal domain-containing protein [Sphingorhabdus sp. M41]
MNFDQALAATGSATPSTQSASTKLNGDFDMFLKLLTTQMQNQDPLSPMDTAQYTQQLVQFSQVEQSIQQTGTLNEILARLSVDSLAQAAGFIGREATVEGNETGGGAGVNSQWQWQLPYSPTALSARVTDSAGKVVATRQLDSNDRTGTFTWDGQSDTGVALPKGAYRLELLAQDASGGPIPAELRAVGLVEGVSQVNGMLMLTIGGQQVSADKLLSVALSG